MHLLWTLLIGLIVGFVAKLIMPGRNPRGFLITILLGVGGAWLATHLGRMIGLYHAGSSAGLLMSVGGAVLLLYVYHLIFNRS